MRFATTATPLINATETTLGEVGDKVSAEVKQQAESAVAQGKAALEGNDIEAIKAAIEAMQQAGYKLAGGCIRQPGCSSGSRWCSWCSWCSAAR